MGGTREQGSMRDESQIAALWVWKGFEALAQSSHLTDMETEAQYRILAKVIQHGGGRTGARPGGLDSHSRVSTEGSEGSE